MNFAVTTTGFHIFVQKNELSNLLGVDKETVENYINLLEKCFVVFRLDSFNRNLRNEIQKGKKVYFYDNEY